MNNTNFESESLSAKDIAQIERLRIKSGLPQTLSDKALLFGWNKYRQQLVKTSGFLISVPTFLLVAGLLFIDTPPEISWGVGILFLLVGSLQATFSFFTAPSLNELLPYIPADMLPSGCHEVSSKS